MRQVPGQLGEALDSIVTQLDVLTQTVSILEHRLTLVENVIAGGWDQRQACKCMQNSSMWVVCRCG